MADELDDLVTELRTSLASSEGLDPDQRTHLEDLASRIDKKIDRRKAADAASDDADEDEDEDDGILDHVGDAVDQFEVEHPGLVTTLNRIANALSAGGI